jgi:hypothetical protein
LCNQASERLATSLFGVQGEKTMSHSSTRRDFLRTTAVAGAGLLVARPSVAAGKKKVLLFTKSSGFEHAVIKVENGKPSIMETALRNFSDANNFELTAARTAGFSTPRNFTITPQSSFSPPAS